MRAYKCDNCGCGACIIFDMATNAIELPATCAYHDISDWKELDMEDAMTAIQKERS